MPRIFCLLLLLLLLVGCCSRPWQTFDMPSPPDRSCRTNGGVSGYDVYIWKCVNNQKVVISQYTAEMSCKKAQKETVACGQLTPLEKTLGELVKEGCSEVPESQQWPKK